MFTQIRGPDHHFNAFYEDNEILIQFIVEEFIQSYQLTFQIKALIERNLNSIQTLDAFPSSLVHILNQLVGCFSQQESSSFSRWTKGPLTKFKEYCEQFSRNSSHRNSQHINLHLAAHQAWLMALGNIELLNSSYTNPYLPNPTSSLFLNPLKRAFYSLQRRFNQISRYLPGIISVYWNNENVILCLLRKKDLLTEIYGSDFLYKRFKWPMKTAELFELLVKRYQARGFDALLPTLQHLFETKEAKILKISSNTD